MLVTTRLSMRTGSLSAIQRYPATAARMTTGMIQLSPMKGMPEKSMVSSTLQRMALTERCR